MTFPRIWIAWLLALVFGFAAPAQAMRGLTGLETPLGAKSHCVNNPINFSDPSGLNPGIVFGGGTTAELLVTGVVVYTGYQILHQPISQLLQNLELPNIPPEILELFPAAQPATLQETLTVTGGFINVTPVAHEAINLMGPMPPVILLNENAGKTGKEILQGKIGSIKQAPLPKGSPSWAEIENMSWEDIEKIPGHIGTTLRKLLKEKRFNKKCKK